MKKIKLLLTPDNGWYRSVVREDIDRVRTHYCFCDPVFSMAFSITGYPRVWLFVSDERFIGSKKVTLDWAPYRGEQKVDMVRVSLNGVCAAVVCRTTDAIRRDFGEPTELYVQLRKARVKWKKSGSTRSAHRWRR